MRALEGKTAIVTGATKGIGNGLAHALASNGANVVVVSRTAADCARVAQELAAQYQVKAYACPADITNLSEIERVMNEAEQEFGTIDIMVNNAGSAITKRAEELTEADWDRVLNIDLKAVFFCAQAAGRRMIQQKSGKIINVASILGLVGDKQVLPYCVAKGGVVQMTRALALEWAKHNIQVNALCPGYIMTDMNRNDLQDERISKHILGKIAMRRYGQVEELKGACTFLASDASNYMTGQTLVLDGGWTCE